MLSNGVSVERFVKASAERVFALLADPARHREIDGSGTLRDVRGGSTRLSMLTHPSRVWIAVSVTSQRWMR